jgi:hypothetical protein
MTTRAAGHKDGIHEAVIHHNMQQVNPEGKGTKAAAHIQRVIAPGEIFTVRVRFTNSNPDIPTNADPFVDFEQLFQQRSAEADEFYAAFQHSGLSEDERRVQRQTFAGLMWSKQFYHYNVELWLKGDPGQPPPAASRKNGRNAEWQHLDNLDELSIPDKWEYLR